MKLAGVVVLYQPNEEVFLNILSYVKELDVLYAVDNSDNSLSDKWIEWLKGFPNIKYKAFGENMGIAYALNYAAKRCQSYHYLLTMDQDSAFAPGDVVKYKKKIEDLSRHDVAIYAVVPDGNPGEPEATKFEKRVITSGSIVDLSIMRQIGGFADELFIDYVDFEYCYRVSKYGYKILRFGDIFLNHHLGELKTFKRFGRTHVLHVHNALRRYYMTRNCVYLLRKYPGRNFHKFKQELRIPKRILLYEDNKTEKLKAWALGFKDGILGNMGKCHYHF